MNSCLSAADWRLVSALLVTLFLFGILYNWLVAHLGERKDGYTALLVVGGVLVTLGAVAVIEWRCAMIAGLFFAASGTPMIVGDVVRAIRQREDQLKKLRELHNAGQTDSSAS